MKDNELTAPSEMHIPSIEECIESIECLFKNSQGSDYNYQLNVIHSPWNILKLHILNLKVQNVVNPPRKLTLCGTGPCNKEEEEEVLKKIKELKKLKKDFE